MIDYIYGIITEVDYSTLVIESNGIGYLLNIANPTGFQINESCKVYTYLQVKDDGFVLYGFKTREEKDLFLRLIEVSGLGPKTVINMFSTTTSSQIIQAIETGNTAFLKKLPGIGPKAAQQIILDLKGKLVLDLSNTKQQIKFNQELLDAKEGLKSLGFKVAEIDAVLEKLATVDAKAEDYMRQALKMLKR